MRGQRVLSRFPASGFASTLFRVSDRVAHRRKKRWDVADNDAPHQIRIRTLVIVDQDIAQVVQTALNRIETGTLPC